MNTSNTSSLTASLLAVKSVLIYFTLFLFPLIFTPFTEEFFNLSKLTFLSISMLAILSVSTCVFLLKKKLVWQKSVFDIPILLLLIISLSSALLVSANKVQSLIEPTTGFVPLLSVALLYFVITQIDTRKFDVRAFVMHALLLSSVLVALLAIFFAFNPLQHIPLGSSLGFLQQSTFTPLGRPIDGVLFIGFFLTLALAELFFKKTDHAHTHSANTSVKISLVVVFGAAFLLSVFTILKPATPQSAAVAPLPPVALSWEASVETLKKPLFALLGVGQGNYVTLFTRVKPLSYNMTDFWQINFTQSRSYPLQVLAENGVLGIGVLLLILAIAIRQMLELIKRDATFAKVFAACFVYLLAAMTFFPPSFPVLFLFFILLALITHESFDKHAAHGHRATMDLSHLSSVVVSIAVAGFVLIAGSIILVSRSYYAEVLYKSSLDSLASGQVRQAYESHRKAIQMNPYAERFRVRFSQLNLAIAVNLARGKEDGLTADDRQRISLALQSSIAEAKSAVALNPDKSAYWENLALVYRNILTVAEGADAWAISSYQRAMIADPSNPILRLNLGGVYYALGNHTEAQKYFEQAVALKQDFANAHYNLAWNHFRLNEFEKAIQTLTNIIPILDKTSDDYAKAIQDLSEFENASQNGETEANTTPDTQAPADSDSTLALPTEPETVVDPRIQLPDEASPDEGNN